MPEPKDDLEAIFGPKPDHGEIELTPNYHGWRCQAQLWSTLNAFASEWPECIPRGSKSHLYSTAAELVAEVGEKVGPRYVKWASQIIRNQKPELISGVKNCGSFMFLMGEWKRSGAGDVCPECGLNDNQCPHEWGGARRRARYNIPD